jgi:hypothetical protein
MVNSAQRDSEFVADLEAETTGLREPQHRRAVVR